MLLVVSLAFLWVASLAQLPHPCRSPEQIEGQSSIFDPDQKVVITSRFAYDDTQRRFWEMQRSQIGRDIKVYELLFLDNEDKHYKLNLLTRECNVTANPRPWRPYSVPPDARFRGTADIGAAGVPDEHVIVNLFDGRDEDNSEFLLEVDSFLICLLFYAASSHTPAILRWTTYIEVNQWVIL
ncbi:uncharacterized protein [Haliotis cracherodii]|uniref:uncharacterized protein n=1 Tax=Haliotis cracherodii TaxID=6455 RepID=UPI0039ED6775